MDHELLMAISFSARERNKHIFLVKSWLQKRLTSCLLLDALRSEDTLGMDRVFNNLSRSISWLPARLVQRGVEGIFPTLERVFRRQPLHGGVFGASPKAPCMCTTMLGHSARSCGPALFGHPVWPHCRRAGTLSYE